MDGLISVVVTTYNRPDAIGTVLRALARQTDDDFEVVVADDGSGPETAAVIERWSGRLGAPLVHRWQPDEGFRAARARNRAILASSGAYIVLLDGDCVPRPNFVAEHRRLAERGFLVGGPRVLLNESLTTEILHHGEAVETWRWTRWLVERLRFRVNRVYTLLRLPGRHWRGWRQSAYLKLRTANLAFWREDLFAVDGFDERYEGWGLEDTDLAIRLRRLGVRFKDGRCATTVIHLWHPAESRSREAVNRQQLAETSHAERLQAVEGLSRLRA